LHNLQHTPIPPALACPVAPEDGTGVAPEDFTLFVLMKGESINIDKVVKSLQGRHSRERGSPEVADFPGFPRSRE